MGIGRFRVAQPIAQAPSIFGLTASRLVHSPHSPPLLELAAGQLRAGRDATAVRTSQETWRPECRTLTHDRSNIGMDNQIFFSGQLSGPLANQQLTITGTPFAYDPGNGNLLLTVLVSPAGPDTELALDSSAAPVTERVYAPNGSGPGGRAPGLVTQFSTIPGIPPGPTLAFFPASITFPNLPLSTTSAPFPVTLTNSGTTPLAITNITATGDFKVFGNFCGTSISPGSGCTVSVTFTPTALGLRTGSLSIFDNASNSPQSVALTSAEYIDTDGDGIPDDWEINGVTINGVFLNLPAMGANPMHKDVFLQTDYMVLPPDCSVNPCTPGHSHQPQADAIKTLIAAYANAPVSNPDGTTGITLHLDCGQTCIMNPLTGATRGGPRRRISSHIWTR